MFETSIWTVLKQIVCELCAVCLWLAYIEMLKTLQEPVTDKRLNPPVSVAVDAAHFTAPKRVYVPKILALIVSQY